MASVTVTIPNSNWTVVSDAVRWAPPTGQYVLIGSLLSVDGATDQYLSFIGLTRASGNVVISISGSQLGSTSDLGPDFSAQMESSGTITFTDSGGASVAVDGISDAMEPYIWVPSNVSAVSAFANSLAGLSDRSLTVKFYDGVNSPATGTPTISGDLTEGQSLTCDAAPIEDDDGLGVFSYQWKRGGVDIAGATGSTYTLVADDVGDTLTCVVSFTDGNGNAESRESAATAAIASSMTTTPLALSDFDGTGYATPIVKAILPVTVSGADITVDPVTPTAGELVVATDLTIDNVERHTGGLVRLRRSGTGDFSSFFDNEGSPQFPDAKMIIVLRDSNNVLREIPFTIGATGSGFNNWNIDNAAQESLITDLATGGEFMLFIAEPQSATSLQSKTAQTRIRTSIRRSVLGVLSTVSLQSKSAQTRIRTNTRRSRLTIHRLVSLQSKTARTRTRTSVRKSELSVIPLGREILLRRIHSTQRDTLRPYFQLEIPYILNMDDATRYTRESLGVYQNVMRDMIDIDRIPRQMLDFAALRWGALAWPIENFIADPDQLDAYKRQVLRWTWDLNNSAGQIIGGRWRAGDIISHELRRVDYSFELGHVNVVNNLVDETSFAPAGATELINAIRITITPRSDVTIGAQELAYLRRVYRAYLPFLLYVMPVNVIDAARFDFKSYGLIHYMEEREFLIQ